MESTLSTYIFGATAGYCSAFYLGAAPALGISIAAITDRTTSILLSKSEKQELFDKRISDLVGIATAITVTDLCFSPLSSDQNQTILDFSVKIAAAFASFKGSQTLTQYFSPSKLLTLTSIIPGVRYIPELGVTLFATKIIKNQCAGFDSNLSKVLFAGLAVTTLGALAISDIAYPIFSKFFLSKKDSSPDLTQDLTAN